MKQIIIGTLVVFLCQSTSAQDSIVKFAGGLAGLQKMMLNNVRPIPEVGQNLDSNKSYVAILNITPNGAIGDLYFISLQDTVGANYVLKAILKTSGNWINKSNHNQPICLPINLIYQGKIENPSTKQIPPNITVPYYINLRNIKVQNFHPVDIYFYEPQI